MPQPKKTPKPETTERVVLRLVEIPVSSLGKTMGLDADTAKAEGLVGSATKIEAWVPALCEKAEHGKDGEVRIFRGSKRRVIEDYAGKKGAPNRRVGRYRAPSLRAWRGGEEIELPPEPQYRQSAFED